MSPMSGFTGREASDILSGVTSSKHDSRSSFADAAANYRAAKKRAQIYADSQVDAARSSANSSIANSIIGAATNIGAAGLNRFAPAKKAGTGISYDPTGYQKTASAWSLDSLTVPPWMSR